MDLNIDTALTKSKFNLNYFDLNKQRQRRNKLRMDKVNIKTSHEELITYNSTIINQKYLICLFYI